MCIYELDIWVSISTYSYVIKVCVICINNYINANMIHTYFYSVEAVAALRKKRQFRKFTFRGLELERLLDLSHEELLGFVTGMLTNNFSYIFEIMFQEYIVILWI
jgi:hypothetical protein